MNALIRQALELALERRDVSADVMEQAIGALMDGQCEPVEIAALLTALRTKGESVDEIVGAARAMRRRVTRIPTARRGLLDTCGTGGDQTHTFNISTATALVVAAAGVPVAKHGNRSVSSSSGSADVLEALGVNVQLGPEQVAGCLDQVGIGFCFAPLLHSAMKHAAPVRRQLGFRTIFNLLGPLTNPAGAEFQLLGANRYQTAGKLARALSQLGCRHALVVCCDDGLDEVGLWGRTAVFAVAGDRVNEIVWTADSFGLPECRLEDLQVRTASESAEVIRRVLAGQSGPERNIILANAAAALIAAQRETEPTRAVRVAAEAIDSGRAREMLRRLVDFTTED
ncbi:MAG: anthranilate phosphoribosyltransferase [Planctomycetes bacterium]|nr:anthranilate phosphoribosyltransferase [Planctomycetota bacterium]